MVVGLVTSTILARNLRPEDFGVVGIALIVIGFLERFSDMGVSVALVQRPSVGEKVLETAQTLNLILAVLLFGCALIAAPFAVRLFHVPAAAGVISALSLSYLFSTIGFLPGWLLQREMRFGRQRTPLVVASVVRGCVSVGLALAGAKYWSLVLGNLASFATNGALLRVVRPVGAKWRIHPDIARDLLRFGLPFWFSALLMFVVFNIDNFFVGSVLGATALGYYTIAWTWSTYVCTTLYQTVHSVLFSRFSRIQQDRQYLAEMYHRSLRVLMFAAVLVNSTLYAVADGFLVTVLGKGSDRWLPCLVCLQILCVYGALRATMEPIGNVIMAVGKSKLLLKANAIPAILEITLLPLVTPKFGLEGVAYLVCVAYVTQWLVYGRFLKRELGVGLRSFLGLALPVLAAAVSAVVTARAIHIGNSVSWSSMLVRAVVVCLVFTAVHELLTRGTILSEVKRAVESRGGKNRVGMGEYTADIAAARVVDTHLQP